MGRTPRRRVGTNMLGIVIAVSAICCAPDLYCPIDAARGDARAIGGPRHRRHPPGMPAIDEDLPAICRIPDLRRLVLATRGDALAIGGPRHRRHDINLPSIRVPALDEAP